MFTNPKPSIKAYLSLSPRNINESEYPSFYKRIPPAEIPTRTVPFS